MCFEVYVRGVVGVVVLMVWMRGGSRLRLFVFLWTNILRHAFIGRLLL